MRLSRYFMPTLRDAPSDAQIVSHRLMLRAGLVRQIAAVLFVLLWLTIHFHLVRLPSFPGHIE